MSTEQVAVLDPGSFLFKAGIVGNTIDVPPVVRPSFANDRELASVQHAVQHGHIADWKLFETLLDDILYKQLGWKAGEEGLMLIAEPNLPIRAEREQLTKHLFEHNNIGALLICDSATLSLYSIGKLSGMTIDIGYAKTEIIRSTISADVAAVVDGVLSSPTCFHIDRGMANVHTALHEIVQASGQQPNSLGDLDARCYELLAVNTSPLEPIDANAEAEIEKTITLPDGQRISLGASRFEPAEALLGRQTSSDPSNASAISFAAQLCEARLAIPDQAVRKVALENILVCGGGSSLTGLPQRVVKDVNACLPPSTTCALFRQPEAMPEKTPQFAAWLGGAVLVQALAQANLTESNQYFTKTEFNERGASAIHKRCSKS